VVDSPDVATIAGLLLGLRPRGGLKRFASMSLIVIGAIVSAIASRRQIQNVDDAGATLFSVTSYRTAYVSRSIPGWYFETRPEVTGDEAGMFAFSSVVAHVSQWLLMVLAASVGTYLVLCG
jgi:hypothetical protein